MLLERGYNDLGIQALLAATGTPKGSFYHHFADKEDFALQVIDAYMVDVHAALDACLQDPERTPLARVRHFFEMTQEAYREQGYMGCLLGGLGQELSGVSAVFRGRIEACISAIAGRIALCLEEARAERRDRRGLRYAPARGPLCQLLGRGGTAQPPAAGCRVAGRDARFLFRRRGQAARRRRDVTGCEPTPLALEEIAMKHPLDCWRPRRSAARIAPPAPSWR